MTVLDKLLAQWARCGGDKCQLQRCRRCQRYALWQKRAVK